MLPLFVQPFVLFVCGGAFFHFLIARPFVWSCLRGPLLLLFVRPLWRSCLVLLFVRPFVGHMLPPWVFGAFEGPLSPVGPRGGAQNGPRSG